MNDQHILPHELIMLIGWLGTPAIAVTLAVQVWFFAYRGIYPYHSALAIIGSLLTAFGVLLFSLPLWLILPKELLPASVLPEGWIPPFFLPAVLTSVGFGVVTAWWVVRHARDRHEERTNTRKASGERQNGPTS